MEAPIDPVKLATAYAQAAADMKATDITILDMRGLVYYTDMFVLCSANNRRQVAAIADEVRAVGKASFDVRPLGVEGTEAGKWVLCDMDDVVVHIFDTSMRGFYDLDGLWADAPRIDAPQGEIEEPAEPTFF